MPYARPVNGASLSPEAKTQLLERYADFYLELARRNPAELNKKLPRSALAGPLDRIGALIVEEARTLAGDDLEVRRFLDENKLPVMMNALLPDDFRVFCLLLNGLKQWLSAEQAATDRFLLGGTARTRCRQMATTCFVTGLPLNGEIDLHHPVRDGRPPIPLSREGHRIIENHIQTTEPVHDEPLASIEVAINSVKKPNESWRMLRRGCRLILGLAPNGGTAASNASAKVLANRAIRHTGLSAQELLDWLDATGLGLSPEPQKAF